MCEDISKNERLVCEHDTFLVIRKWHDYIPDGEFRCFVSGKRLIAICQRKVDRYLESILNNLETIRSDIMKFYSLYIEPFFVLNDFTFDIFWLQRKNSFNHIRIIDFNVYGLPTDAILFSWDELDSFSLDQVNRVYGVINVALLIHLCHYAPSMLLRFLTTRILLDLSFVIKQIAHCNKTQYTIPIDLIDVASGHPEKLIDLVQYHIERQNTEAASNQETNKTNRIVPKTEAFKGSFNSASSARPDKRSRMHSISCQEHTKDVI
ncbi:unnamed protein product [Protopolystoma xenopodis]|uniref:Uncharacterized protein n=1 Tax=Protopolystoma xenopodis TaxID=117903 RepID=A0A3S5FEH9_9PLAT|nr:unnamed protein product [Protopolystoma xenopodis]